MAASLTRSLFFDYGILFICKCIFIVNICSCRPRELHNGYGQTNRVTLFNFIGWISLCNVFLAIPFNKVTFLTLKTTVCLHHLFSLLSLLQRLFCYCSFGHVPHAHFNLIYCDSFFFCLVVKTQVMAALSRYLPLEVQCNPRNWSLNL